ncbi:DUF305 domain-containing protein [Agromyces sp. NPDC055520]
MFNGTHRSAAVAAAVAAVGILFAGCTIVVADPDDDRDRRSVMMGGADSAAYSATDLMFARMMIPHHEQAVEMSELAIETSADPDLIDLTERIRDTQTSEIALMEGWLDDAGRRMPGMDDTNMGRMFGDEEMEALEEAKGAEFDTLYLESMIDHHELAIRMTQLILDSDNADVQALGESIVETQTAEIELMEQMLSEAGPPAG